MAIPLSDQDRRQLEERGLNEEDLRDQLDRFERGVSYTRLERACVLGDGIGGLTDPEREAARQSHATAAREGRFVKFVPASGAASRMFKPLLELQLRDEPLTAPHLSERTADGDDTAAFGLTFFRGLRNFAFYPRLQQVMKDRGRDAETDLQDEDYQHLLAAILDEDGLDLANRPKGLIPFHRMEDDLRTPVAEHVLEAAETVADGQGLARLHFTVSPEHREAFSNEVRTRTTVHPDTRYQVGFSVQSPTTDTVAVTPEHDLFHLDDGRLLFRPGGHGALIHNLNELDGDLVYVKNIDNVVPPSLAETTIEEKRMLGGLTVQLVERRNHALRDLDSGGFDDTHLAEIADFARDRLEIDLSGWEELPRDQQVSALKAKLDRPLRVCGMVRNEGDPGGGPYWVRRSDNTVDRQIVETSQIDREDPQQAAILAEATHFNPVDLVLALRNHRDEPYDLREFVDPETAFISNKSKDGRELKALEWPGLWNGAMADWITVFIEVPGETFNPVKTVNDLLKNVHQA